MLEELLARGEAVEGHRPWPRVVVDADVWRDAVEALTAGDLNLVGLWVESGIAHLCVRQAEPFAMAVLSLACPRGVFPSIGAWHAPAIRLERAIFDLWGLRAEGALDLRPWLDHGRWGLRHPEGARESGRPPEPYAFLAAEGESLHQIAVGPIHAGIIEPGHFRFTANGETVVRLEERLGYVHRGLESLMAGSSPVAAARLAGRASGDSTVAYAIAFARAVEAALGVAAPARAEGLRGVMAELERVANHLGDIGAICNDASFALMLAHCAVLRDAEIAFGHRLMMDCVTPGGVAVDLEPAGADAIRAALQVVRERLELLTPLYDETASLQDRMVGTGVVSAELARRFAAGGYVGRASGGGFDARRALAYAPYDGLKFEIPSRTDGDVNARVWIRLDEIAQSLSMIEQLLTSLPPGSLGVEPGEGSGEGAALVEGFRGDILAWVKLEAGRLTRCHLRDPSWFQWPLLEACIEGNIVADFPLCNKSFNCSYAGVDL